MPSQSPSSLLKSETLLLQIIEMISETNTHIEKIENRLTKIEQEIEQIKTNVKEIITEGFTDGDLKKHRIWHAVKERSWFSKK